MWNHVQYDNALVLSTRGGVAQCIASLTHDRLIPVSRAFEPHQRPRCLPEQETLL